METDALQICDCATYRGRNIYSHHPVIRLTVELARYAKTGTNEIPGFNERLLAAFPGLAHNTCGLGYEGGFLTRLREGTLLGHVLEHVALEMQAMLGYDVRFGKTRLLREPGLYTLVYEYENEICGLECGKAGAFILNCFVNGEDLDAGEFLDYLRRVSADAELGPSTTAIVEEAKSRGIPVTRIGHESLVQLGYGRHSRRIESTLTDATSCLSADISCNKQLTKMLLSEHQIPVPYGKVVYSELSAVMAARQLGAPVVVKPFDGNQGKGVHLNLQNEEEIRAAFRDASRFSSGILVERCVPGRDFRILVVGGKVCAVSERLPAAVQGDGVHTVEELVEEVNRDERRGEQHEKPLTKIKLDAAALELLKRRGMTEASVPAAGETVPLRENGNLSTGGTAIDRTETIHPENAALAVRAAQAIGIDIAGIDVVAVDIARPIAETGGAVVEVNAAPGIRMHLYPSIGTPRNVAKDIVELLFPTLESCKFPIVSVTGTNGKTTVVRMVAHALEQSGLSVGYTSTSGSFAGGRCICRGDHSGPVSARALLANRGIDAAVLETARGGILRGGLGYDLADVGVITNITGDHLGLDGVETLEDLAFVKALVAEAVKPGGCAVLNAADPTTPQVLERVRVRPALFARSPEAFTPYRGREALRAYEENGCIVIADGGRRIPLLPVAEIPAACGGLIGCNVENALAAAAALYGLGISPKAIAQGLRSFAENEGRFSFFSLGDFRVVLDYGHNPAGYAQALDALSRFGARRLVGVVGAPGDRADADITRVGELCARGFSRLYIKEDADLRGRRPGEVSALLEKAALAQGFSPRGISVVPGELDALQAAVRGARPGDLIAVFYENYAPLEHFLTEAGAQAERVPGAFPAESGRPARLGVSG